jgi:protein SCO1/2
VPSDRRRWILGGIVLAGIVGASLIDLPGLLRPAGAEVEDCVFAEGPCVARFEDGLEVVLGASPGRVPTGEPMDWSVSLSDPAAVAQRVDLYGVSMNMGLTRVPLEQAEAGWTGHGGLPICTLTRMKWRAEVLVQAPGEDGELSERLAGFEFFSDGEVSHEPLDLQPSVPATYSDFTLQGPEGPLALSDARGQLVLMYFGYTACPDVCPTTLSTMSRAVGLLSEAEQAQVSGMFVSVDPERDQPERLGEYAAFFHPSFRAGTSDPESIRAIAGDWGVVFRKVGTEGSAMAYTVDHSTSSFLVGREGELLEVIPHGTSAEEMAELLRAAL